MSKTARRRSRELALQGLYEWLVAGSAVNDIARDLALSQSYPKSDQAYVDEILRGVAATRAELEASLVPLLDRPIDQLSPIEHAVLLIAAWELAYQPALPFRVVTNEAIELVKSYGGTDGHKFVNGVLDKLAGAGRARSAGDAPPPADSEPQ